MCRMCCSTCLYSTCACAPTFESWQAPARPPARLLDSALLPLLLLPQSRAIGADRLVQVGERQERWTSLLELKGLASALETNFIVFTTQLNPGTMSGRMIAYFIGANPLPNVSCRYGGPLLLCLCSGPLDTLDVVSASSHRRLCLADAAKPLSATHAQISWPTR